MFFQHQKTCNNFCISKDKGGTLLPYFAFFSPHIYFHDPSSISNNCGFQSVMGTGIYCFSKFQFSIFSLQSESVIWKVAVKSLGKKRSYLKMAKT